MIGVAVPDGHDRRSFEVSDLKLFRTSANKVSELSGGAVALEKSLQDLFERNLDALLGVRFLASEFVTNEGGRMDTLGIDENGSPVIIEYKRATNENVINQGLFYLNWLMGHRKDFEWLVLNRFGMDEAKKVDWSGPRLICIAGDFTKYDEHAVRQMDRNIDLIRYRKFEGDLLLLEQLTATTARSGSAGGAAIAAPGGFGGGASKTKYKTVSENIDTASPALRDRYELLVSHITALGDDVTVKVTDLYVAFRRIKNFACAEVRNQVGKILVYVKVDPDSVELEPGFTRDVRKIGHYGTGDLEIVLSSDADLERAKPLLDRAYNES
jgi:predicted transport protein